MGNRAWFQSVIVTALIMSGCYAPDLNKETTYSAVDITCKGAFGEGGCNGADWTNDGTQMSYPATVEVELEGEFVTSWYDGSSSVPLNLVETQVGILAGDACAITTQPTCTGPACTVEIAHTKDGLCALKLHVLAAGGERFTECYIHGSYSGTQNRAEQEKEFDRIANVCYGR